MDEQDLDQREIILEQRRDLERVLREEAWYLGERLHRFVDPHELAVQLRAADIWLESGQFFREQAIIRIRARQRYSLV